MAVDPHAFQKLWPMLGVWFALFLTAGDGITLLGRQAALRFGHPASAIVVGVRRKTITFQCEGTTTSEKVVFVDDKLRPGRTIPVHVLPRLNRAYLDSDRGYSSWKGWLFGAAFVALWIWAMATYRFG